MSEDPRWYWPLVAGIAAGLLLGGVVRAVFDLTGTTQWVVTSAISVGCLALAVPVARRWRARQDRRAIERDPGLTSRREASE